MSTKSLGNSFKTAVALFGKEAVLEALRVHFSDICTATDVSIRKALDAGDLSELVEGAASVTGVLDLWIVNGELTPDPWWAS